MNITLRGYQIASWTLLCGGVFHSSSDILSPKTDERIEIMTQMKALTSHVLGTEFNMFSFFQGFSLMMGLLTFGYGALNVLLLREYQNKDFPINILILNIIITLICLLISIKYFFIIPITLTAIPFVGFTVSLIAKKLKND